MGVFKDKNLFHILSFYSFRKDTCKTTRVDTIFFDIRLVVRYNE